MLACSSGISCAAALKGAAAASSRLAQHSIWMAMTASGCRASTIWLPYAARQSSERCAAPACAAANAAVMVWSRAAMSIVSVRGSRRWRSPGAAGALASCFIMHTPFHHTAGRNIAGPQWNRRCRDHFLTRCARQARDRPTGRSARCSNRRRSARGVPPAGPPAHGAAAHQVHSVSRPDVSPALRGYVPEDRSHVAARRPPAEAGRGHRGGSRKAPHGEASARAAAYTRFAATR